MTDTLKDAFPLRILVLDDELETRRTLAICLEQVGHRVITCTNVREALQELSKSAFDLIFLDLHPGLENGLDYLPNLLTRGAGAKAVIITAFPSVATAVEAMKLGAADYLPKPFTPAQVVQLARKVADQRTADQKFRTLQTALGDAVPEADLSTTSLEMKETLSLARHAAVSASPVLITGETGVGKNLLARLIHEWSDRANRPFITATYRGEPATRIEADLFGRGKDSLGRIKSADTGTLVLDDIAELPQPLQAKLLRLIQSPGSSHNGNGSPLPNIRLIAITQSDPTYALTSGKLAQDLFYTLSALHLTIPALRNRPDDITLLAERYLAFFAKQYRRPTTGLTVEAADALRQYAWPGNIRELRHVIERAVLSCKTDHLTPSDLPIEQLAKHPRVTIGDAVALEVIEEMHIRRVLAATGSFDEAATILKIDPATLWRKRKRYGC